LHPPRSPWVFPGPRVFSPPNRRTSTQPRPATPLLHFRATPAACPHARRFPTGVSGRPGSTLEKRLAEASLPYGISGSRAPSFHDPFRSRVLKAWPTPRKSRPQGLATLSTASARRTLGDLFQPPTPLGFSLQSFPPPRGSNVSLLTPFRSCASLQDLPASHRRSSDFLPPEKPCPFSLPKRLIRVGAFCSPGTLGLSGLPSADPTEKPLPSRSPSRPSKPGNLTISQPTDPRVSPLSGSASPPKGRLPV